MHAQDCTTDRAEREAIDGAVLRTDLSRSELASRAKHLAASAVVKLPLMLQHGVVIQRCRSFLPVSSTRLLAVH
jgi:hypothetical protein